MAMLYRCIELILNRKTGVIQDRGIRMPACKVGRERRDHDGHDQGKPSARTGCRRSSP